MIYKYENEVLAFAKKAHGEQKRKYTGEPYINHCIEVAEIVKTSKEYDKECSDVETMVYAALLHDVIEDTEEGNTGLAKFLRNLVIEGMSMGQAVGVHSMVVGLTDVSNHIDGNRAKRKDIDRIHLKEQTRNVKTIKLADIISNAKSIIEHDKEFARVYIPEMGELLKVLKDGDFDLYMRACYEVYKAKMELDGGRL